MHPALKNIVQDPTLGLVLYALARPASDPISRLVVQPWPTFKFAMDNVIVREEQLTAIANALSEALGQTVEIKRKRSPIEVVYYLPDKVKLHLLIALLEPEVSERP